MKRNFAVCAVEIGSERNAVQLFPAGEFVARDGRPGKGKKWRLTEAAAASVIALAAQRQTPFVIDYEHQTLTTERNGQPAPAAGWFTKLEWRPGKGLYAVDVAWTDAARGMIDSGEYRFISPVFSFAADGTVLELHMAGLTNNPAIDGMDALAAAKFKTAQEGDREDQMFKELLKLLGLAEDASVEQAVAALKAVLADAQRLAGVEAELAALKTSTPDPAKFVPFQTFKELQDQFAALRTDVRTKEVNELVEGALAEGKLLPSMKQWAVDLGNSDLAALKSYIGGAQPIAALKGTQTGGNPPGGSEAGTVDDTALAVCRQMGVAIDDYKKTLGASA